MKAKATHNRKGFTGHIVDEEMYEKVKQGKLNWRPTIKSQITHYNVPAAVFDRLLELDRSLSADSEEVTTDEAATV